MGLNAGCCEITWAERPSSASPYETQPCKAPVVVLRPRRPGLSLSTGPVDRPGEPTSWGRATVTVTPHHPAVECDKGHGRDRDSHRRQGRRKQDPGGPGQDRPGHRAGGKPSPSTRTSPSLPWSTRRHPISAFAVPTARWRGVGPRGRRPLGPLIPPSRLGCRAVVGSKWIAGTELDATRTTAGVAERALSTPSCDGRSTNTDASCAEGDLDPLARLSCKPPAGRGGCAWSCDAGRSRRLF